MGEGKGEVADGSGCRCYYRGIGLAVRGTRYLPGVFEIQLPVSSTSDERRVMMFHRNCSHLLLEQLSKDFPLGEPAKLLLGLAYDNSCIRHVLVHSCSATSATNALISFFRNLSFLSSASLPFSVS
jgi:hypothetical protein